MKTPDLKNLAKEQVIEELDVCIDQAQSDLIDHIQKAFRELANRLKEQNENNR